MQKSCDARENTVAPISMHLLVLVYNNIICGCGGCDDGKWHLISMYYQMMVAVHVDHSHVDSHNHDRCDSNRLDSRDIHQEASARLDPDQDNNRLAHRVAYNGCLADIHTCKISIMIIVFPWVNLIYLAWITVVCRVDRGPYPYGHDLTCGSHALPIHDYMSHIDRVCGRHTWEKFELIQIFLL